MFAISLILGSMIGVVACYGLYGLFTYLKENRISPLF